MIDNFENTESLEDKAGNTYKSGNSKLVSFPHFFFAHNFSAFTINKLQNLALWMIHIFPL